MSMLPEWRIKFNILYAKLTKVASTVDIQTFEVIETVCKKQTNSSFDAMLSRTIFTLMPPKSELCLLKISELYSTDCQCVKTH